jgi:predicted RNA-binding Zn-ribbon protein involved in translation (DUF1610 family)
MIVRIVHDTDSGIHILELEISDKCPVCGSKRGTPRSYDFHENGERYSCDVWQNPCGHIDKYINVYKEAHRIKEF